jgi:hypothetical protein
MKMYRTMGWMMVWVLGIISLSAQGAIISEGKSYSYSEEPNWHGDTTPPTLLTDGVVTTYYGEGKGAGWSFGAPGTRTIQIDLGSRFDISEINLHMVRGPYWGVTAPHVISIAYSENGSSWTDFASWNNPVRTSSGGSPNEPYTWQGSGVVSGASGRYVKIDLTMTTKDSYNIFMDLDEVRILGEPIPEPATVGLLVLGALGLLRRK